jgi:glycosyltransferase involved in cell wall biosynthesis
MTKTDIKFITRSNNSNVIEGGLRLKNTKKSSTNTEPLISVITVVYNGAEFIESAIKSVLTQSYQNIEYIIVDGNSNDNTLEIIKQYDEQIDYWLSEKDNGIYDAMNKGISLCTGDYIGILNADDYYALDTCDDIKKAIINNSEIDIFHGNVQHISLKGESLFLARPKHESMLKSGMVLRHPSCFVSRQWYESQGGYDVNLKIASDYKFLYSSYRNGARFKKLNLCTTFMREGGVSDLQAKQGWKEVIQVAKSLGDSSVQVYYYSIIRHIKYFINKRVLKRF